MSRVSPVNARLLAIAACVAAATFASGLAAANTVESSGAGDGSADSLPYALVGLPTVSLSADDPQEVGAVTFTIDPIPSLAAAIRVKVGSQSTNWHDCPPTGMATITCLVPGTSAFTADELRIVVAD